MTNTKKILYLLALCLVSTLLLHASNADTVTTDGTPFVITLNTGDSFSYQDILNNCTVTVTITSGTLNASATLTTNDAGGVFRFVSTISGTLTANATLTTTALAYNSIAISGAQNQTFTSGQLNVLTWNYDITPSPTATPGSPVSDLPQLNVGWLWVYLNTGDFLGFFQALYLSAFTSVDILYGILVFLFMVPIYLRTKSLLLICILWILIGGFFLAVLPVVAGMSIVFLALGIGGLLFRLFRPNS